MRDLGGPVPEPAIADLATFAEARKTLRAALLDHEEIAPLLREAERAVRRLREATRATSAPECETCGSSDPLTDAWRYLRAALRGDRRLGLAGLDILSLPAQGDRVDGYLITLAVERVRAELRRAAALGRAPDAPEHHWASRAAAWHAALGRHRLRGGHGAAIDNAYVIVAVALSAAWGARVTEDAVRGHHARIAPRLRRRHAHAPLGVHAMLICERFRAA